MNSQLITLDAKQGLVYGTPNIPMDEKEILYYDLPKSQQYWRTPYDKRNQLAIRDLKGMTEREKVEYMETWRRRWADGMWVFIDGEPVYICGMYVDHLVFNRFGNRHLNYNESQRDDFYFRELIWNWDEIDGTLWLKPRRYGMTTEEITQCIRVLLSGDNYNIALQSATQKIMNETIVGPLIDTYLSRPSWMREDYYKSNGKRPRSGLELINPMGGGEDSVDRWLGGRVFAYATNAKAMEGKEHMYVVQDEFSKNESGANPRQIFEVNRKTIRNAGRRGKISCLSTTGDSDDVLESIKEWVKLAGESAITPGARSTNSGLIKRFVSSLWTQYLPEELLPNKYGKIDHARNQEWVENEINKKQKGTKEYYYEKRKLPLTEEDALISATEASYFSKIRLIARRKDIEGMPIGAKPYIRGVLVDLPHGKVGFVSDEERAKEAALEGKDIEAGMWLISVLPFKSVEKNIDTSNRFAKNSSGVYIPVSNPEFVGGYDPIRYRKEDTKSQSLSRASIIIHKVHDYFGSGISDEKAALYLGRPDDPEDAHREAIKACRFFGCPMMHERNIESVKRVFEEMNMLPFLLKSEKDGLYGMYTDSGGKIVKNGVDMLVVRYAAPKTEDGKDHIAIYPFEDGLIDLENFDISQTTQFDVTMSEIMLEYGIKQVPYTNQKDYDSDNALNLINELIAPRRR